MTPRNSRRAFLMATSRLAVGCGVVSLMRLEPAHGAPPAATEEAIRRIVGAATITPGRVKLELPPLSENGNAVPMTVTVDSPMTSVEHVKALHVFTEKNPQPDVVSFRF